MENGDYIVGYGDGFYFGASKHIRHATDYLLTSNGYEPIFAGGVNECSDKYIIGNTIGSIQ